MLSSVNSTGFQTSACIRSSGGLAKTEVLPPVSDSVDLGWGLRIFISNEFSGNTDAAGPGTTL